MITGGLTLIAGFIECYRSDKEIEKMVKEEVEKQLKEKEGS